MLLYDGVGLLRAKPTSRSTEPLPLMTKQS
jgi:hypothetical protein